MWSPTATRLRGRPLWVVEAVNHGVGTELTGCGSFGYEPLRETIVVRQARASSNGRSSLA